MKIRTIFRLLLCLFIISVVGTAFVPQSVLAAPSVTVSPAAGAIGTKVTVTGYNFTSYAGDKLKIFYNETEVTGSTVAVSSTGGFTIAIQIPDYAMAGVATISVRNWDGASLAEGAFTVYAPEIRLDKLGGKVGAAVNASIRGFYAGKPVTVSYSFDGYEEMLGSAIAGETGECTLKFNIPASPRGKHLIIARNDEGNFYSVPFEVIPDITIEPRVAATGDKVMVYGKGFPADIEITVSMSLYEPNVAYAKTHERGSFTAQFIIPVLKAGSYLIAIEEFTGGVLWSDISIVSRITLSKVEGEVGGKITISGTGFEVKGTVFIRYDAQEETFVNTDENGAFSFDFTVPRSVAGPHIITATDGINIKQVVFTVESDAPAPPEPMSPKSRAEVTSPVTLDWESVYDLSQPLVYSIEIARTGDFMHPVLRKDGITASQYKVNGTESLLPNRKGTFYYWRVSATDGASNTGEWSQPALFRVKPVDILPAWSRYVLVIAAAAIIALYTIQIRRGLKESR